MRSPGKDTILPRATLPPLVRVTGEKDTILREADSMLASKRVDTFDYKVSKDTLGAQIDYKASDSIVMVIPTRNITLYTKAEAKYTDADLTADHIVYDQDRNVVVAKPGLDTAGKPIGQPKIVQVDNTMTSDSLIYNLKTQKAITQGTVSQSGEMFVHAQTMKKVTPEVYFGWRGVFTTCDLDTPHFAFRTNKMKIINKKFAITGPIHPEFEGVPLPIYLPFGFFPLAQGRHSGLLPPTFSASDQAGLGLEGLGYYKVLSDNFDVTVRTSIYTYGGWNLNILPEYKVRYRYSGNMSFSLQSTRLLSTAGEDAYTTSKTFNFNWSHQMDQKARPGTNFNANVNVASTKYNQYLLNNPTANYQNQLSSSITYSKTWDGKYNLTVTANHNQNNETRLVNLSLPNITFTAPTIYPFATSTFVGTPKWYQKLGIGLNSTISGGASFYDSLFSLQRIVDTFQWGAQNSIPISLALPIKGPVQVSPGISLQNRIYSRKMYRVYDPITNKVDTTGIEKGLFYANSMSMSLSLSTAIFGTFQGFGKNSTLMGIRHVIRPTASISYSPDLSGPYYYNLTTPYDTAAGAPRIPHNQRVSYFDGTTYGPFGEGKFGGVSFGLDNHIEIKTRSKTDTSEGGVKKTTIIDGFGFNGSYNYLADSFKLSPITFYFRSTLFKSINITGGATLDPYQTDTLGFDKNKYAWQGGKGFSLGRITSGNLAISTSFKSKPKDDKLAKQKEQQQQDQNQIPMTMEEQQAQLNYIRNNPSQFADFNIPWSLNLSLAFNFTNAEKPDYSGFATTITSSLNWSGDFNLTEKWKVMLSGYYDLKATELQSLTMSISRDLHCWQMSINVTPVGYNHYFSITISPKARILQDLK
ncbi:MAG TPA: putative LPS assembly protein LptD, partial [Puia sp.]|nr:putative LPS assembly protein LptD [Puia sp.]